MITMEDLLALVVRKGGSDLHVSAGSPPRIRIDGIDVGPTPLTYPLAPGVYRIEAEFPDGRSVRRQVEIGPERRFVALP